MTKGLFIINPFTGEKIKTSETTVTTDRNGMKQFKKKQNIKMLGGYAELIGKGSYGDVYRPALKCNRNNGINPLENQDRNNYVTKVYTHPDYNKNDRNDEGKELNRIKSINQLGKFHIPAEYRCTVANNIPYSKEFDGFVERLTTKDKPAFVFKYGGVTLDKLYVCEITENVISKIYTLFEGLVIMGNHNILHFDLTNKNIVYSEKNGFKFIDFGLMFKPFANDKTDNDRKNLIKDNQHYIWPWDIKYYVNDIKESIIAKFKNPNPAVAQISMERIINNNGYNFKYYNNYCKSNLKPNEINKLYVIMKENIQKIDYQHRLMKTVDVYSLGVSLYRTPTIYNKMGRKTQELIQLMIHDDAFKRPLPEEALRMFVDAIWTDTNLEINLQQQQQSRLRLPLYDYKFIKDPQTGIKISIFSPKGKKILEKYRKMRP